MKLTIERSALLHALQHIQSVVEKRNTIPILGNVQLVAENDELSLTATDLDIAIVERLPVAINQGGGTTAPAHTLYDIIKKLPDGAQVEFAYNGDDGRLAVNASRAAFALACLPKDDFPQMSEDELPHGFSLPARDLKRLIEKTRFAISTEETRYYLNGIFLHPAGEALRAVATDGIRLARSEVPLPEGAAGMPGVIVPRKAVLELDKLLGDGDEAVAVSLSDTRIRFTIGAVVLTSKLIDGTFPDYERVIPSGNDRIMEVDARVFREAVDRVSTISADKTRAVKLAIDSDRMVLSANNPDQGSASEEVSVAFDTGPLEIGFNSRYLIDIAEQIDGDNAAFVFGDGASPTIVRDVADDSALYVLMPMRV